MLFCTYLAALNNHHIYNFNNIHTEIDKTFIDGLYDELKEVGKESYQKRMKQIFEDEEYDSDALRLDVEFYDDDKKSNISQLLNDKPTFKKIQQYVLEQKCIYLYCNLPHCLTQKPTNIAII